MKLHTYCISTADMFNILDEARKAGNIAEFVHFDKLDECGSRSHDHAFEVKLGADMKIKGDGRRWTNSGNHGKGETYSALYDEWGWFIAGVFEQDPDAKFGPYADYEDFHNKTHGAYQN